MTEVTAAAYLRYRNFTRSDFVSMRVGNAAMGTFIRRDVGDTSPDGPAWTSVDADNPQIIEMVITGADADVTLPQTFERVQLMLADPSSTIVFDGTFSAVTLTDASDELTVRVRLEVPEIP